MKRFIFQILIFTFIIGTVFIWICSNADGNTDPFYIRFTSPKQNNLIIGTSRAAQGLQPNEFNEILGKNFYNYAFTVAHSPFGSTYLKSIKRKIKPNLKDGVFIITVDPWSLSSWTNNPNDSLAFRELKLSLSNTNIVNINPNPFYILNNWNYEYYKILSKKPSKMFLHNDGWLEVTINMDSTKVQKRIENKVKTYKEVHLPKTNFSEIRYKYLKETIKFLQTKGVVYLIRLPIHPKLMQIDNELSPIFNNEIKEAINLSSGFLDLTDKNNNFKYTDGNHLEKESGKLVSGIIASWIKNR